MPITINIGKPKSQFVTVVLKMGMGPEDMDRVVSTQVDVGLLVSAGKLVKKNGAARISFYHYWDWLEEIPAEGSAWIDPELLEEGASAYITGGTPEGKICGRSLSVNDYGGFVLKGYWDYDGSPIESNHVSLKELEDYLQETGAV